MLLVKVLSHRNDANPTSQLRTNDLAKANTLLANLEKQKVRAVLADEKGGIIRTNYPNLFPVSSFEEKQYIERLWEQQGDWRTALMLAVSNKDKLDIRSLI